MLNRRSVRSGSDDESSIGCDIELSRQPAPALAQSKKFIAPPQELTQSDCNRLASCPTRDLTRFTSMTCIVTVLLVATSASLNCQQQHQDHGAPKQVLEISKPALVAPTYQNNRDLQAATGAAADKTQLYKLLVPASARENSAKSSGSGVDLVALNLRRFEQEHHHKLRYKPNNPRVIFRDDSLDLEHDNEDSLARSRLIEAHVAALPEHLLDLMPDELTHQVVESVSSDLSLLGLDRKSVELVAPGDQEGAQDPDGASIERLTKSCLTVQASSLPADQLNVTFHLYTRANPTRAFVMGPLISRDELVLRSPFRVGAPVKWITHGFHTNLDKSHWMLETRDKILAHEDANVILTDWRRGASPALAFYPKAAANAHVVAKMIVKILRRLAPQDVKLSRVHLIGHSLGAHIMGFVGSAFTEEYLHKQQQVLASEQAPGSGGGGGGGGSSYKNGRQGAAASIDQLIGRITACDPALPCFGASSSGPSSRTNGASKVTPHSGAPLAGALPVPAVDDWTPAMWTHLRPDSAALVEVVHSNPGVMGYAEPLGDYDFFPNGSERQPGCGAADESPAAHAPPPPQPPPPRPSAHRSYRSYRGRRETRQAADARPEVDGQPEEVDDGSARDESPRERRQMIKLPSGLRRAGGFVKAIGQFIKPIRDFFQAYTCSHHRSVEYMVESLYYELVPAERRLEPALACQMVGYRCQDYRAFKRGFCFSCHNDSECRTFGLGSASYSYEYVAPELTSGHSKPPNAPDCAHNKHNNRRLVTDSIGYTQTLASQYAAVVSPGAPGARKRSMGAGSDAQEVTQREQANDTTRRLISKRILPTIQLSQQYRQTGYAAPLRNQYFFDTRPQAPHNSFCLAHYHFLVRYRWFRIRESVALAHLQLFGSLGSLTAPTAKTATTTTTTTGDNQGASQGRVEFNKFTQHTYTMLLTTPDFLGKLETLLVYGDHLRPTLIDYIEVSYLSNIDPEVRAAGSARLCRRVQTVPVGPPPQYLTTETPPATTPVSVFVRCQSAGSKLAR